MKTIWVCVIGLMLAACVNENRNVSVTGNQNIDKRTALLMALDVEHDGYKGVSDLSGATFEIVSTSVGKGKLCRVVSIKSEASFEVETFCKIKGGKWR